VTAAGRERAAPGALAALPERCRQAHVLLARLAARDPAGALPRTSECGMQLVEVGTPYLHRQHGGAELPLLPAGTR
jgi:light-independent protochlorophyllide reductase subunit N